MSDTVIRVENIAKQYRLGKIGTGTFMHDINRWWHIVQGKEDPYLKIGEVNDRSRKGGSEYVWALKDITFDVKQGDLLGIIGRNGAGKSTLLKLLSRTTLPNRGSIKIKGRVASLLEVGTGFHPELTGRENIFLNGAILGMTKSEIKSKFDEIVDFSGVEKYIDTPVKRYSSGMYVRLAFAVAAHLEPEILIVDEVLAVGDAEFQKKALGKMQEVSSGQGRTVLFVSHNMGAIRRLCKTGLYLKNGQTAFHGAIDHSIKEYLTDKDSGQIRSSLDTGGISIDKLLLFNQFNEEVISFCTHDKINFVIRGNAVKSFKKVNFAIGFNNIFETRVMTLWSSYVGRDFDIPAGDFEIVFQVQNIKLMPGEYFITTYAASQGYQLERIDNFMKVSVSFIEKYGLVVEPQTSQGYYLEDFEVNYK